VPLTVLAWMFGDELLVIFGAKLAAAKVVSSLDLEALNSDPHRRRPNSFRRLVSLN
jgi:hypothetical protein